MKKININRRSRRTVCFSVVVALVVSMLWGRALLVHAYTYAVSGASKLGTVTIVPITGNASANGYYTLGGYRVTYTIQKNPWTAFLYESKTGFYIGNNLNESGGCNFGYQDGNGVVSQAGAIQLGCLTDGKLVAEADCINNQVSCTFTVNSLSELPTYIAYAYRPAPGAYIHLGEEKGMLYHVWHYQSLAGTTVSNMAQIDTEAPTLQLKAESVGDAVINNGKTWSKKMNVIIVANDPKSGVQGAIVYQGGKTLGQYKNSVQSATYRTMHSVTQNGTYEVMAYDKLNNQSKKITIVIDTIDLNAPIIERIEKDESGFCLTNKITCLSKDEQSGLAPSAYSWNGGEWTDSAEFEATENGVYELAVRDALGNEARQSLEITNIDNKPPVIESVKEIQDADGKVKLEIRAVDPEGGCGLHESAYSFDGGKTWQPEPSCYVEKNGTYYICVRDALESVANKDIEVKSIREEGGEHPIISDIPTDPETPKAPETPQIPENPITDDVEDGSNEEVDLSVSGEPYRLHLPRLYRSSQTTQVDAEEYMAKPEVSLQGEIISLKPVQKNPVQKAALAVLLVTFIAGLLGLGCYLWLFYLQRSCVLYGLDDKQERVRIGRMPIRRLDTEWQVKIPDERLGEHGTGRYLLVFHPSFVKEESPTSVIITIAERSLRELLEEEVIFCI